MKVVEERPLHKLTEVFPANYRFVVLQTNPLENEDVVKLRDDHLIDVIF